MTTESPAEEAAAEAARDVGLLLTAGILGAARSPATSLFLSPVVAVFLSVSLFLMQICIWGVYSC